MLSSEGDEGTLHGCASCQGMSNGGKESNAVAQCGGAVRDGMGHLSSREAVPTGVAAEVGYGARAGPEPLPGQRRRQSSMGVERLVARGHRGLLTGGRIA